MQENHIPFYCKQKAIDNSSDIVIQHANQSSVLYPKNISSGIFIKMKRNSGNIIKKKILQTGTMEVHFQNSNKAVCS